MDDSADGGHEIAGIVEPAVGIVDDSAAGVRLDVVAVDEPAERRATIDLVLVRFGGYTSDPEMVVDDKRLAVVGQSHLPRAQAVLLRRSVGTQRKLEAKGILLAGLVGHVQFAEGAARFGKCVEVGRHRHAGQVLGQIASEAIPVLPGMQHAVDVVEDRVLADRVVSVVRPERRKGGVGDVVYSSQFGIGVVKDAPCMRGRPIGGSTGRTRGSGGLACGRR